MTGLSVSATVSLTSQRVWSLGNIWLSRMDVLYSVYISDYAKPTCSVTYSAQFSSVMEISFSVGLQISVSSFYLTFIWCFELVCGFEFRQEQSAISQHTWFVNPL